MEVEKGDLHPRKSELGCSAATLSRVNLSMRCNDSRTWHQPLVFEMALGQIEVGLQGKNAPF